MSHRRVNNSTDYRPLRVIVHRRADQQLVQSFLAPCMGACKYSHASMLSSRRQSMQNAHYDAYDAIVALAAIKQRSSDENKE